MGSFFFFVTCHTQQEAWKFVSHGTGVERDALLLGSTRYTWNNTIANIRWWRRKAIKHIINCLPCLVTLHLCLGGWVHYPRKEIYYYLLRTIRLTSNNKSYVVQCLLLRLSNEFLLRTPPKHENLPTFFHTTQTVIGDYNSIINVGYYHWTLDKPSMSSYWNIDVYIQQ